MVLSFEPMSETGIQRHRVGTEVPRPNPRPSSLSNAGEVPRMTRADAWERVESVRILPSDNEEEKRPTFRLQLSLGSDTLLSSQLRRTGTVANLEMEVEEKELAPLSRLSGRRIKIGYLLNSHVLRAEVLQEQLDQAEDEIARLKKKLRAVQDQLAMMVENQIKDSR